MCQQTTQNHHIVLNIKETNHQRTDINTVENYVNQLFFNYH